MNRLLVAACFALLAVSMSACGGNPEPQDNGGPDTAVDAATPDVIVDDVTPDTVAPDARDTGIDTDMPHDVAMPDADDASDAGDVEPADTTVDGGDEQPFDACTGPDCWPPCDDDGISCTDQVRNDDGVCEIVIATGFCLIDGVCYFNLEPDPENGCLFCDPAVTLTGFSPHAGLPCDDGNLCTAGDYCDSDGVCTGGAGFGCDDDNICTIDQCDELVGCINTPRAAQCDDGDACTYQDQCNTATGVCRGVVRTCNDGKACTRDYCDPFEGCVFEPQNKSCDDGDGCTVGDWCSDDGECVGQPRDCDDHKLCTDDSCIGGTCFNDWHYHGCDDGDACTDNDYCNPAHVCAGTPKTSCDDFNPCTDDYCDPAVGCVNAPNTNSCEPLSACEVDGVCTGGVCVGKARNCEDGNLCTIDSCDTITGCRHVPTSGACNDYNACTINENCSTGQCLPPAGPSGVTNCNDLNDCTADNCDIGIGCVHTPQPGECEDADPCSLTGTGYCQAGECISNLRDCDDNQPCTLDTCDGGGNCIHPPATGACNDGNMCTSGETCTGGECTNGSVVDCDDDNVCTLDDCNDEWGCAYTPTPGNCTDNDVCTINDQCGGGRCVGTVRACEDYNYCTDNHCDAKSGCFYSPNSLTCNDYNVCTYDDVCGASACHGVSMFENPAGKAATLTYGLNGNKGQGVDVDDDPATCSPKGKCVEGIDNAFSKLEFMFNPEMLKAVTDGSLSMLLEFENLRTDGTPFTMNLFWGLRIDPVTCDPATSGCNYGVYQGSLKNGCEPVDIFANAVISGTKLTAGGAEYTMPIRMVFGDNRVPVDLHRAKIKASVSIQAGKVTGGAGALGGAIVMDELVAAIQSIPEAGFPPPYVKSLVLAYVTNPTLLKPDIDLDGDGTDESVSVGLPFSLVTGNLIEPVSE